MTNFTFHLRYARSPEWAISILCYIVCAKRMFITSSANALDNFFIKELSHFSISKKIKQYCFFLTENQLTISLLKDQLNFGKFWKVISQFLKTLNNFDS